MPLSRWCAGLWIDTCESFIVAGHIEDFFVGIALIIQPALDDLDAIEVSALGILGGGDQERGRIRLGAA